MKRQRAQPDRLTAPTLDPVKRAARAGERRWLAALLAGAMVLGAVAGEPGTSARDDRARSPVELGPFQRFLADPPWIKYVRFRRSGNHVPALILADSGKRIFIPRPWEHFEGAVQPNGFFLRHLDHSYLYYYEKVAERKSFLWGARTQNEAVYDPPEPGEEWTIGASTRHWWQLDERIGLAIVAPREPVPGHSVTNGLEIIAQGEIQFLEVLRSLGMPELVGAEVEWLDAARFQAVSREHGTITGVITRFRDDLVEELEYQVERPVARRVHMRYAYLSPMRLPPVEMVRTVVEAETRRSYTNLVERWEEGLDPDHAQGFTLSEFRQKSTPFRNFLVWSNGVAYKLGQDGLLARVADAPPDYSEFERSSRFGWISSVILLASVMILLGVRVGIWRLRNRNLHKLTS